VDTVLIDTLSTPMQITNGANVTTTTVTEPVPTLTSPVARLQSGVVGMGHGGAASVSGVKLVFFGVGSDSSTFSAYVYGWEISKSFAGNKDLWVPTLLATFTGITLDTAIPGVNATDIPANNFFASAITLGVGNSGISVEVVSPGHAAHEIAHAVISTKGPRFIEVLFGTGSSATSCNCLIKRL